LGPSTTYFNLAFRINLVRQLIDEKMLIVHCTNFNRSIFPQKPNIKKIFFDHVEEIRSFKLGPSTTYFNLAFRMNLVRQLIDEKMLMIHCTNFNRSIFPQKPNIKKIFIDHVEEIKSFKWDQVRRFVISRLG
jgi:NhaP-type Na+/H+ and K+/H+ antiporter